MNGASIAATFLCVLIALASRAAMKRLAAGKLGRAEDFLLEIDFWNATKGEPLRRSLLFLELLSWTATIVLVATQAGGIPA